MSLMLSHQQKMRAARERAESGQPEPEKPDMLKTAPTGLVGTQQLLALLVKALEQDLKSLKGINSRERKAEVKRQLVEKYTTYVERLKAVSATHDLLGWYLVWLFDIGELDTAVEYGLWCVREGVVLPERFNRDVKTFVADAILEWTDAQFEAGHSVQPYFAAVLNNADGMCCQPWDLPDEVTAKFYRQQGLVLARAEKFTAAVDVLEEALSLGAKVKTALADARKKAANR
ncbi:phage terminase small subunit, partial [Halodesulfovibrio aestuarii]|uniref:phage terminase small subunit n=1 Tax=Halodesulfovibrio aestuarii TaxID=126333 RepID=UPI0003F8D94B